MKKIVFAALIATVGFAGSAYAEASKYDGLFSEQEMAVVKKNSDYFARRVELQFKGLAPNGVLTKEMLKLHNTVMRARNRGMYVGQYMMFDLSGDFIITKEELDQVALIAPVEAFKKQREAIMQIDAEGNKDGKVSISEVNKNAIRMFAFKEGDKIDPMDMMRFDLNKDSKVELKELTEVLKALQVSYPAPKSDKKTEEKTK